MRDLVQGTNVVDFEPARVRRHALSVAAREAKSHRLTPDQTREALAWAAGVATWVTYAEVEPMVVAFCAAVFVPPQDRPSVRLRRDRR